MRALPIATLTLAVLAACSSFASNEAGAPSSDAGVDAPVTSTPDAGPCDPSSLDADPKNCGACGHDCLGGACKGGACQPVLLTRTTAGAIGEMTVDGTTVYWTAQKTFEGGGQLESCPKTGSATPDVGSIGTQNVISVASDGARVFAGSKFGGTAGVYAVGKNGLTEVVGNVDADGLVVRSDGVFFVGFYEGDGGFSRSIRRYDPATMLATTRCVYTGTGNPNLAAFTTNRAFLQSPGTGEILSCPLDGTSSPMTTFTTNTFYASSMTGLGSTLYWAQKDLVSCAEGTSCASPAVVVTAAKAGADMRLVTSLGQELLVTTTDGRILLCDAASCASTLRTIVTDPDLDATLLFARNIAGDDQAVYYAAIESRDADGGVTSVRIMKIAR